MLKARQQQALSDHNPIAIGIGSDDDSFNVVILDKDKKILLHACYHNQGSTREHSILSNTLISLFTSLPNAIRSHIVAISINYIPELYPKYQRYRKPTLSNEERLFTIKDSKQAQINQSLTYDRNSVLISKENPFQILHSLNYRKGSFSPEEYQLRQKADWLMGWLLNNWQWVEESNSLKWGWSIKEQSWMGWPLDKSWIRGSGDVVCTGSVIGSIATERASMLGLSDGCLIIASTNNDNAGVIANLPKNADSIVVLNNRLSLNCRVEIPLISYKIINYRLGQNWIAQGLSRAGTEVLKYIFPYKMINDLCRQIDPNIPSGIFHYPLVNKGEDFPVDHRYLVPLIEPRPISDSLYLHALLEGLANIEYAGLRKMQKLSSITLSRVVTLGHGASNSQWKSLRQRIVSVEIQNKSSIMPSTGLALLALHGFYHALDIR
ncbi:Putative carbohydrate kinase, FGGY family protein (chromatophore) [Paulinella micropora]|uniref:Carbohydrate kinase, FGGY family protein n=1 Tax=Paulinella micropora TaxID=1928728 RepID=A0A1L5YCF8_9EUKA|nr:putative carbohydrate kinase, FGGY family protein [Paulinella micropora]AQX45158.1 putative carbohydrate kinase, FGGY family protein [Paulinella micropora]BBL86375.1 Putative carbohydrate kinase, FGGY family protein [Paulinella micropora]